VGSAQLRRTTPRKKVTRRHPRSSICRWSTCPCLRIKAPVIWSPHLVLSSSSKMP